MCSFIFSSKEPNADSNRLMVRRGPDNTTLTEIGDFYFMHNLLSITGEFTPQPFIDEEREVVVVYNGEIYNAEGYKSDGHIIIPRYFQYGFRMPNMLDGEFAICLVDYRNQKIILSTDVFATKPLWWSVEDGEIGVASYESALLELGFKNPKKVPANTRILISMDPHNKEYIIQDKGKLFDFNLDQRKDSFVDWNTAFENAIRKRTQNCREKIFIGLSSGYDSGAIACELRRQNVAHTAYSLTGTENMSVMQNRHELFNDNSTHKIYTLPEHTRGPIVDYIRNNVEPFKNTIHSSSSNYNEYGMDIVDDHGGGSLAFICEHAIKDGNKVYLSGSGADEIFSDYGFQGVKKYQHSNFGGLFPDDLSTVFPWASFYGSSQETYIAKEEHVAGSFGIETRYPYLDKYVVQEFLNLTAELKNSKYKSVLYNYLTQNNYPFCENEKIGF
jgi:asparagine synthetase B (glutamine-hydrolysing)